MFEAVDDEEMKTFMKVRGARNAIGKALGRAYPNHPWHVMVSGDGTVAQIMCPAITTQYGMVLRINRITEELERKAVQMGGELLERFNVSRTVGEFGHIQRDARGNAVGGKRGEE